MNQHESQIAELPPVARRYYDDTLARAPDGISARELHAQLLEQLRENRVPPSCRHGHTLAMTHLRGRWDPEFAATLTRSDAATQQLERGEMIANMTASIANIRQQAAQAAADGEQSKVPALNGAADAMGKTLDDFISGASDKARESREAEHRAEMKRRQTVFRARAEHELAQTRRLAIDDLMARTQISQQAASLEYDGSPQARADRQHAFKQHGVTD